MDSRFSRRWSETPDIVIHPPVPNPKSSHSSHVSPSYRADRSTNNITRPQQRWSMAAPTSSLNQVETIDYDTDDTEDTTISTVSKRERRRAKIKGIMRQLFVRKYNREQQFSDSLNKSIINSSRLSKSDLPRRPLKVQSGRDRESDIWNRLTIVVRPPKRAEKSSTSKGKEREKEEPLHDSKFSSLQSLQASLPLHPTPLTPTCLSDAGPNILLAIHQLEDLLTQVKNAIVMVKEQESLTEAFSKNLAGLMWGKERSIAANRRLDEETKTLMVGTVAKMREQTARIFSRKGAFLERSLSILVKIDAALEKAQKDHSAMLEAEKLVNVSSSMDSDTVSRSSSSSYTLASATQQNKISVSLSIPLLQTSLQTLKADLTAHSRLDPALRNIIVLPCQETRFPATENDGIAMRRFVRFVDGRIKKLGQGYWDMGRWVRGLEGWVDDFIEAEGGK